MPIKMRTPDRKIKFSRVLPMLGGVMDPALKVLPVCPREEPFAKKPIFSLRNLKISFVKKFEIFRASYETLKGFPINP